MNILVTYWSQTGNTGKLAGAISDGLSALNDHLSPAEIKNDATASHDTSRKAYHVILKTFEEVETLEGFDLIFIGFPVMQFGPPPVARKFITANAEGKKIALFVTHATPSQSNDPGQQALLEKELERCKAACSRAVLLGLYHCQGELSEKTAGDLLSTGIPMLMEFAAMRPQTIGHPDEKEIARAVEFARAIVSQQ